MKNVDVLVIGGGLGGVAAALAAGKSGAAVLLVEPSEWLGGQLTAQGVCTPDEAGINDVPVVETCGSTATYRDLKHRIREWYRGNTQLSAKGVNEPALNPGSCWVNFGFGSEPNVSITILGQMLAEVASVEVWMGATVQSATADNGAVTSVTVQQSSGDVEEIVAKFVLDATETGALLPLLGADWVIGAEAKSDTAEPNAPDVAHPEWIQSITVPFTLTHRPKGQSFVIDKPENYEAIRDAQGFSLVDGAITSMFTKSSPFWTYRRVIDSSLFNDDDYRFDVANINVAANDYRGMVYPADTPELEQQAIAGAVAVSQAFTFWLQTECPRDEGGQGYPELEPTSNFWENGSFIAPQPYVRESRRIIPLKRVVQTDIDANFNSGPRAKLFDDSCGIGNYGMDVHAGPNGAPELEMETKPYQIPLGALIPQNWSNLLASCKNIGTTHISNGAYRLHPQEWNVGESAGTLAAFCVAKNVPPANVFNDDTLLLTYQVALLNSGVPVFWWTDVVSTDPQFVAVQLTGLKGIFSGESDNLTFNPTDACTPTTQQALSEKVGQSIPWPGGTITRAAAAELIAKTLGWLDLT